MQTARGLGYPASLQSTGATAYQLHSHEVKALANYSHPHEQKLIMHNINPLKCCDIKWLHLTVFTAIQV